MLFESQFESQLWVVHDSNKQYIAAGDAGLEFSLVSINFTQQLNKSNACMENLNFVCIYFSVFLIKRRLHSITESQA